MTAWLDIIGEIAELVCDQSLDPSHKSCDYQMKCLLVSRMDAYLRPFLFQFSVLHFIFAVHNSCHILYTQSAEKYVGIEMLKTL